MSETGAKYFRVMAAIAAVGVGLGILGFLDLRSAPYAGYSAGRELNVIRVRAGSPAESAGLLAGDVIKSVGGIPIEDTKALARRPRADIGETRTYVVERGGEVRELDITFGPQPAHNYRLWALAGVVGLCFLTFCLWAYRRAPGESTRLLALFGLSFGVAFLRFPYLRNYYLRILAEALATVLLVAGFAFLIHYLMLYPKRREFLDKPWAMRLIYGPAVAMTLFFLFLIVVQPDYTDAMRLVVTIVSLLFVVGYFGGSLVAMTQSYLRARPEERHESGISLMLLGAAIGLLPFIAIILIRTFAPSLAIPGGEYCDLALALIPITFAIAAVKRHRTSAAAAA